MSEQPGPEWAFEAELWLWKARSDSWTFVTVPEEVSADLADEAETRGPPAGFGSIKVEVACGTSRWNTSVFPNDGGPGFVLPVKKAVRRAEALEAGDTGAFRLRLA